MPDDRPWNPRHDSDQNDYWKNLPSTDTPIIAQKLNDLETSVDYVDKRVLVLDSVKAEQTNLLLTVKEIAYNKETGTFYVTRWDGYTYPLDTDIEKIAINFDYDDDPTSPHYQCLVLTLDDGGPTTPATVKYIDLSALVTQYEFVTTSTIAFTIGTGGAISANVLDGSITESKLQPNFLADCRAEKTAAQVARAGAESAQSGAETSEDNAEAWAVGKKNGVDVPSTDPQYHNNAKYWSDETLGYLNRLAFTSINVATSDWEVNNDPVKSTNYPYICKKEIQGVLPDNPNWRMVGSGNIPIGTEIDSISFVLEAWFGTGEKYYTDASTYTDTTAGTILLYSTALPVDNLRLQYKGV